MDCRKTLLIGPRTFKDILDGKKVRKHEDGAHVFEDYWTSDSDSDSTNSDIPSKKQTSKTEKENSSNLSGDKREITCTRTRSASKITGNNSPAMNTRLSKPSMSSKMNSNFQTESPYKFAANDCPSKNTRLSHPPEMNLNIQTESPYKIDAYHAKDTRLSKKSITSRLNIMKDNCNLEKSPFSKSVTINAKTPTKNLDHVLAELAEDVAILSKTNDKPVSNLPMDSPKSIGNKSCTSKTFVAISENSKGHKKNLTSTFDDVMHGSINVLSPTKILDCKSSDLSDATEARVRRKEDSVPEIVNASDAVTDENLLTEGPAVTETVLLPNNDTYSSKYIFTKNLSLLPKQVSEFLKQNPRKSVRLLRSHKTVEVNENLEQFDEYDAKIMQMIKADSYTNSTHKSSIKEPIVEVKQTNSTNEKNRKIRVKRAKPVGREPSSHRKANSDLTNNTYISEQIVERDNSKKSFELLNDEQNVNDDTLPIISDKHLLNKTHTILKSVENKSCVSKNNKSVSKLENCKQKNNNKKVDRMNQVKYISGQSNEVSPDKFVKNIQSKANNEINSVTHDCEIDSIKSPSENTINKHSPKKRKTAAHEESNTVESDLSEYGLNDYIDHTVLKAAQNKSCASKNSKRVSKSENCNKKSSNKEVDKTNQIKYISGQSNEVSPDKFVKNTPSKAINEINSVTHDYDIYYFKSPSENIVNKYSPKKRKIKAPSENTVNKHSPKKRKITAPSENTVNKHSPKKRKIIAHQKNTTTESHLSEHDLNDHIQDKEFSELEHELGDNIAVSVNKNIDTNVYAKNGNSTVINRLLSTDAVLSSNGSDTDVSEIHDFHSSMPKDTKQQNLRGGKSVEDADHTDKQNSSKRKVRSKNTNVLTSMQKATKKKTQQDTYNKQHEQQEEQSENYNIRKSTRTKYKPLASWKNERLLYGFKNGVVEIVGLDPGSKAADHIAAELDRKNYFNRNPKKKTPTITKPKKAKIVDPVLRKEMKVDLHKKFDLISWHVPTDGMNSEKPDYAYRIKKLIETSKNSFGYIQIAVGKEKPNQYIPEEDLTLTLFKGKVEIVIQGNSYTLCIKDTIIVPRGSAYCLKNIGNVSALLSFVVGRFKFTDSS